jgi:hypothetical protein
MPMIIPVNIGEESTLRRSGALLGRLPGARWKPLGRWWWCGRNPGRDASNNRADPCHSERRLEVGDGRAARSDQNAGTDGTATIDNGVSALNGGGGGGGDNQKNGRDGGSGGGHVLLFQ